jgi:hypothetical protein
MGPFATTTGVTPTEALVRPVGFPLKTERISRTATRPIRIATANVAMVRIDIGPHPRAGQEFTAVRPRTLE